MRDHRRLVLPALLASSCCIGIACAEGLSVTSPGTVSTLGVVDPLDPAYGAVGDGVTDDTAALNKAAAAVPASGGELWLRGHNFAIAGTGPYNAVLLHSNTTLHCDGATITAIGPNQNSLGLVQNVDYAARTLTDHDIRVEGCTFIYPNWQVGAVGKAIQFWFASHISVRNNTFFAGANGTAMIGVVDSETTGNRAYGVTNAAYDHWWGGGRHRVINNYAEVAANNSINSWGVQFTGTDTNNNPAPIDDVIVDGNTIYYAGGSGAPIGLDGTPTGTVSHATITRNHVYLTTPGSPSPGIYTNDGGSNVLIADNTIDGTTIQPAIFAQESAASAYNVLNNVLSDCSHSSLYGGNIQIAGSNSTVIGNRQINCVGSMVSVTGTLNTVGLNDDGGGADAAAMTTGTFAARSGGFAALGAGLANFGSVTASALAPATGVGSIAVSYSGSFWTPPVLTVAPPPGAGLQAKARPGPFGLSYANIAQTVALGNGGYTAGEGLILVGGTIAPGGTAAVLIVNAVDAKGNPTNIQAYSQGSYSVLPPDPVTFTAANGTGFSAHVAWFAQGAQVVDPGSGYSASSPPAVTATGCTSTGGYNSGCGTFTATVAPTTVQISGLPLCAVANTGQLCAAASTSGAAVEVK